MAYPPTVPSGTRINTTPQVNLHPADHNEIHGALTDIINILGTTPNGEAASLTALLSIIDPADKIVAVGGATAPTGWALCDGSAVSRTTYAATFARIGTTYGVGDGSTTFNLPDLRSKFIAGKGTATWSNSLNETGGSKDAVAVAHDHSFIHDHSDTLSVTAGGGSHAHVEDTTGGVTSSVGWLYRGNTNGSTFDSFVGSSTGSKSTFWYAQPSTGTSGSTHNHTISGSVSNNPSTDKTTLQSPTASGTDANLPPYVTLNYVIRLR